MLAYTGNGAYCYTNSLHMSLLSAGATRTELPEPGFIECLTTMPFGNMYLDLESGPLAFFSPVTIDPNEGLVRAAKALGWTFEEQSGGSEEEALTRLRAIVSKENVLVGPVDMGYLSYSPNYKYQAGGDHFVVVLALKNDHLLLHDPQGYPCAMLSVSEFMQAWKAERIDYKTVSYTMRTGFRQIEQVNRQEMIEHTLPLIRENLLANPGGPVAYSSAEALTRTAAALRRSKSNNLQDLLLHFGLPLAAKRNMDGAAFLSEAG